MGKSASLSSFKLTFVRSRARIWARCSPFLAKSSIFSHLLWHSHLGPFRIHRTITHSEVRTQNASGPRAEFCINGFCDMAKSSMLRPMNHIARANYLFPSAFSDSCYRGIGMLSCRQCQFQIPTDCDCRSRQLRRTKNGTGGRGRRETRRRRRRQSKK